MAEGAIVNADVKNIPETKLAIILPPNNPMNHCKMPICVSRMAITAPIMIKQKSFNNSLLADTIVMGEL